MDTLQCMYRYYLRPALPISITCYNRLRNYRTLPDLRNLETARSFSLKDAVWVVFIGHFTYLRHVLYSVACKRILDYS
jgi:hypothetical protein